MTSTRRARPFAAPGSVAFTLLELLIVITILAIVLALSVPFFFRSRMAANEAVVISTLKHLFKVEIQYYQQNGSFGALDDLSSATPPYVDPTIASGEKAGFIHEIWVEANGKRFHAQAKPSSYQETGARCFYIDETGLLRYKDLGESKFVSRSEAEDWQSE